MTDSRILAAIEAQPEIWLDAKGMIEDFGPAGAAHEAATAQGDAIGAGDDEEAVRWDAIREAIAALRADADLMQTVAAFEVSRRRN